MADTKISALTAATTPLDGTEVLPIVQSSTTKKVANNDLRPKQIQSNATSGVLQIAGPGAATTRVMTTPNSDFTVIYSGGPLGTPSSGTVTNLTGTASININGTVGATTPAAGTFTTVTTTSDVQIGNNTDNNAKILRLLTNITTNDFSYIAFKNLETSSTDGIRLLATQPATSTAYFDFAVVCNNAGSLTERLRVKGQTGDVQVTGGNLVISTSGKGVDFSATASGSGTMTSELLADYEEGTWTGSVTTDGTPPTTVSTATGYYTKIGRQVTVRFVKNTFNMSGSTGNFTVTGLPYTSSSSSGNTAVGSVVFYKVDLPANTMNLSAVITANSTSVVFYASLDQANYQQVADNATTDGRVWFTVTYDV